MSKAKVLNDAEIQEMWEKINILTKRDLSPDDVEHAMLVKDYISVNPGYMGDVLFLLFSGGPECYEVLVEENGRFVPVN